MWRRNGDEVDQTGAEGEGLRDQGADHAVSLRETRGPAGGDGIHLAHNTHIHFRTRFLRT
jgi:hypothetical protein